MSRKPFRRPSGRVVLRDFCTDDVDAATEVVGDPRVTRWLSFSTRDREATARMLEMTIAAAESSPRTEFYVGVTLPEADRVVGFARLGLGAHKAAKLGYAIHADHWGNGYATDAARALLAVAFEDLGLNRVTAAVGPDNRASIRVLDRLGFTYEGRLRQHVFTGEVWRDSLLYSILAGEWGDGPT